MELKAFFKKNQKTPMDCPEQANPAVSARTSIVWLMPAMTCVFMLALAPFSISPDHWRPMFICLGLSIGFAAVIQMLWLRFGYLGASLLVLLLPLFFIGHYLHFLAPVVPIVFVGVSVLALARVRKLTIKSISCLFGAILFGGGGLVLIMFQRSGAYYAQPFMDLGVHKDVLFHVAIAAMIKTYGIASMGLHGLTAIQYHTGSHTVLAALSLITKLSVFDSYAYIYPLVIIPLMITAFLCFAEELSPSLTLYGWVWRTVMASVLILGIDSRVYEIPAFWNSFLLSESYTLAIILLMALLSAFLRRERSPRNSTLIFNTLTIVLLFAFTAISKISVAFVFLGLLGSWTLFGKSETLFRRLGLTVFCVLLFIPLKQLANNSPMLFEPLHFIKKHVGLPLFLGYAGEGHMRLFLQILTFFTGHFVFSHVAVIACGLLWLTPLWRERFPAWLISGIAVAGVVGVVPGMLLNIIGGSAYYFSNVSQLMALPLLLILPSVMAEVIQIDRLRFSFAGSATAFSQFGQKFIKLSGNIRTAVIGAGVFFTLHFIFAFIPSIPRTIWGAKILAYNMMKDHTAPFTGGFISKLQKIRYDKSTRDMMVYVPRTEKAFWASQSCDRIGFIIPVISERSAIRGLPSLECTMNQWYTERDLEALERSQVTATDEQIKQEALQLGFSGVVVLTQNTIRILK